MIRFVRRDQDRNVFDLGALSWYRMCTPTALPIECFRIGISKCICDCVRVKGTAAVFLNLRHNLWPVCDNFFEFFLQSTHRTHLAIEYIVVQIFRKKLCHGSVMPNDWNLSGINCFDAGI